MTPIRTPYRVLLAGVASVAVIALAGACGGDSPSGMNHGGGDPTSADPSVATFNDADVAFAQNMISHHQQAVQMADLAATRANDPELKELASQIKAAQAPEIQLMTGWLNAWGYPSTPAGGHGGMSMPGMMSDADMNNLTAATGPAFDRMFAEMMIEHHNGAIQAARDHVSRGAEPAAKRLATTIEQTQAREVATLQQILDRL
jgi:uncharacterized protein (DUF305 family)